MKNEKAIFLLTVSLALMANPSLCRPQRSGFVITTPSSGEPKVSSHHEDQVGDQQITELRITSNIQFRYARSVVDTYIKNPGSEVKEVSFTMVLPKNAFVSNFSLTIAETEYVAHVREKEVAEYEFDSAVKSGNTAGIARVRDANKIEIQASVEARGKARFKLTYEASGTGNLRKTHNLFVQ